MSEAKHAGGMTSDIISTGRMQRLLAQREQEASARKAEKEAEDLPQAPAKVVRLPLWPEAVMAVPNAVLRSALFGAIKRGARAYLERALIYAQEGISIRYTGPRLDQGDLSAWAVVLDFAREHPMGEECRVNAYQVLKALNLTDSGKNRATLDKRLSRLKATGLDVKVGRFSYEGALIASVERDEETKLYVIRLDPRLKALFARDQFTMIEWAVRHELDGKPLAQWLHGFYSSHAKPFPIRIETLHQLCGSEAKRLSDFKIDVRRSLDAVAAACAKHSQPFSYKIDDDLAHVDRKGSAAQRRHLARKAKTQPAKAKHVSDLSNSTD